VHRRYGPLEFAGPVAQTGKKPQLNWTATANNRTFSCSWALESHQAVAVALKSCFVATGHNRSQPVATVPQGQSGGESTSI
jgi:hypothetical protein